MFKLGDNVVILPGFRGYFEAHQYEGMDGTVIDIRGKSIKLTTYTLDIYRKIEGRKSNINIFAYPHEIALKTLSGYFRCLNSSRET